MACCARGRDIGRVSGTENFQIVSTSATSSTASVIATGVFTAGGVDHMGNKADTFVFPNGHLQGRAQGPHARKHVNQKTCLITIIGHGTFKVSGGTGAYSKISGSGTYKLNILAIGATSGGKCSHEQAAGLAFQQIINATGKVSL